MLAHMADAFTVVSVATGLWAALLWWRSTRVQVDMTLEMGTPQWKDDIVGADRKITTFNSHAAAWTAASVAFQALATVAGRLALLG